MTEPVVEKFSEDEEEDYKRFVKFRKRYASELAEAKTKAEAEAEAERKKKEEEDKKKRKGFRLL